MEFLQDIFALIGRVCVAGTFLWSGYHRIQNWRETVAYLKSKDVPQLKFTAPAYVGIKILGAIMILLGWHAHIGAVMLLVIAGLSAFYFHPVWKRKSEEKPFVKEIAVIGAIFLILAANVGHFGFGS